MGKYIDRAELFNSLSDKKTVAEVFAAIQDAPAANVVEVNRCKTCFHYRPREYGYNCTVMDWNAGDDDFCSRWEEKDA